MTNEYVMSTSSSVEFAVQALDVWTGLIPHDSLRRESGTSNAFRTERAVLVLPLIAHERVGNYFVVKDLKSPVSS
jgi:hypothetical protein